jgi:hypothetical protein
MLYQCFYWSSGITLPSKENDLGHRELRIKEKLCLIVKPKHSFIDGPKMAKTVDPKALITVDSEEKSLN